MNTLKDLKEEINKSLNGVYENSKNLWNGVMTTVQNVKVETELLRKTQTERKLERKPSRI